MICYQDRTFCSRGGDCTCPEDRKLTQVVIDAAQAFGLPVAAGDLCQGKEAKT